MADLSDINSAQSVKIIGSDSSGVETNPVASTDSSADAVANTGIGLVSDSRSRVFNGSTWDRTRSAGVGDNVASTGLPAAVPYVKYNPTEALVSSGNLSPITCDENGSPIHTLDSAAYTAQQKVFSASTNLVLIGTTETPLYLLKNPNASGKKLKIISIKIGTAGGTIRIYHTPTITTNGTALTIVNNRIQTSPTATIATAFFSPTISANGTLLDVHLASAQISTIVIPMAQQLILNPNFNLLVTCQNAANNTNTHCTMVWAEVL